MTEISKIPTCDDLQWNNVHTEFHRVNWPVSTSVTELGNRQTDRRSLLFQRNRIPSLKPQK